MVSAEEFANAWKITEETLKTIAKALWIIASCHTIAGQNSVYCKTATRHIAVQYQILGDILPIITIWQNFMTCHSDNMKPTADLIALLSEIAEVTCEIMKALELSVVAMYSPDSLTQYSTSTFHNENQGLNTLRKCCVCPFHYKVTDLDPHCIPRCIPCRVNDKKPKDDTN